MITDRGMVALRSGAALVAALPGARLRIRGGDRVLAEVRRPPFPEGGPPQVPACVFHRSVAKGHAQRRAGQDLRFMSLEEGVDPAIDVGVPGDGRVLPGLIVRTSLLGMWVHTVPVTHPPEVCRAVLDDLGLPKVACLPDDPLDITLLQAHCAEGDEVASAEALDALQAALARCTVTDLEALLRREVDAGR